MANPQLDEFISLTIKYENFVSQEMIDEACQRLLTEGLRDRAEQVQRANDSLLKIASGSPELSRTDIEHLISRGDFNTLCEEVSIGDGYIGAYQRVASRLVSTDLETIKSATAEIIQKDSTRQELDNPTTLRASDIDFSSEKTILVMPTATKFILPVPHFENGGEPLVYPEGHHKAGQPIVDYEQKPLGDKGIVFENRKESVAAALGDGTAAMIINDVSLAQVEKLKAHVTKITENLDTLTLQQFKEVLIYARDELGLTDIYNTSREWIKENMSPVGQGARDCFGPHKRDSRDLSQAVYVVGDVIFLGTSQAAGGEHRIQHGALIIKDAKGETRAISKRAAARTYMLPNGDSLGPVIDIAEVEHAYARDHGEFCLPAGQVPMNGHNDEITGVDLSSTIVSAIGMDKQCRRPVQGTGKPILAELPTSAPS